MPRTTGPAPLAAPTDTQAILELISVASDITLVLDADGLILDAQIQAEDATLRQARDWRGKRWAATAATDSRQKVDMLLREAAFPGSAGSTGASGSAVTVAAARWRQINQTLQDGEELPVLYAVARASPAVVGKAHAAYIAFGRDLRSTVTLQRRLVETQQTMERDYWRSREAETRYRHLLETSSEAVLVIDGSTQKVLEANPAARQLCAGVRGKLIGANLSGLFDAGHGERLQDLLAAARSVGKQSAMPTRLADGGPEVLVSASVFRQGDTAFVLVRLALLNDAPASPRSGGRKALPSERPDAWDATLAAFVQNSPDALVFCDAAGSVIHANRAFLALAELSSEDQARGQALDRWLGRTGVELGVLITNLRQRGSVGRFLTALRGEYGTVAEVEIAASQTATEGSPVLAFSIRDIERRLQADAEGGKAMTRSATELTELVGRTPLKDIVAETTDLIEQLCIETALSMSNDNRASAAMLLGLSRQSLYVKLRRFGIGNLGADE
jgi:transcriptional regulator PpsR